MIVEVYSLFQEIVVYHQLGLIFHSPCQLEREREREIERERDRRILKTSTN